MQNFSHFVKKKHFLIGGQMKGVAKRAFFNGELATTRKC